MYFQSVIKHKIIKSVEKNINANTLLGHWWNSTFSKLLRKTTSQIKTRLLWSTFQVPFLIWLDRYYVKLLLQLHYNTKVCAQKKKKKNTIVKVTYSLLQHGIRSDKKQCSPITAINKIVMFECVSYIIWTETARFQRVLYGVWNIILMSMRGKIIEPSRDAWQLWNIGTFVYKKIAWNEGFSKKIKIWHNYNILW